MNAKRAAVLAITFAILIILYFFIENPAGRKKKKEPLDLFSGFQKDAVSSIIISSPEKGRVDLVKKPKGWQVTADNETFAADKKPIDKVLETVASMKIRSVVSRNPKNFEPFEVTEGKAIEVQMDDASQNTLAALHVGKSGPDIFSTYVSKKGSDQVVLVNAILKTVFEQDLKAWRNKTIFAFNKDDITEYKVEGNMILHVKQDDNSTWQVLAPETFTPKKGAVEDAVENFAELDAVDFGEDNQTKYRLDTPARTITATLKDGTAKVLYIGKDKNAFQHFVKAEGIDTIFVVEDYEIEAFCPGIDKLKEEEKKPDAPDNATDNQTE